VIELKEIIERCKKYDVTAQRLLYERYANHLRFICLRYISDNHEVKDIVQDSFIKIISKIKQYNERGSFEGWMTRILINTAINHLRKSKKWLFLSDLDNLNNSFSGDEPLPASSTVDDEDILNTYQSIQQVNFTKEELMEAIMSIPDEYRIVFNLFHIEEYSHEEIAKTIGIDVNNSRIRLFRARKLIREELVKRANELQNSKIRIGEQR
jgi:RNA polymerase sigma-70 factor, ECF subfamily